MLHGPCDTIHTNNVTSQMCMQNVTRECVVNHHTLHATCHTIHMYDAFTRQSGVHQQSHTWIRSHEECHTWMRRHSSRVACNKPYDTYVRRIYATQNQKFAPMGIWLPYACFRGAIFVNAPYICIVWRVACKVYVWMRYVIHEWGMSTHTHTRTHTLAIIGCAWAKSHMTS